ncbi:MAG: response regulator transcription factor [Blastocatellia bacterium]|nr:response regulator transcription factor [Blastocatellia bacterium]MCS7156442.1 response regulator transcription factor [Blastocatellia bacterium]MCX7751817.1 response regulator transcription factor [Blastocatellia bacterium]MDW8168919.1 response regulator transcription factor [Acidobacteriota bacterium]MDW8256679.1 response regulator transcription factor [Acidobacteriota bacterium]
MRVLIVEDERKMAEALRRGLEEEGYIVQIAADGDEGLRLGSEREYDLIILDIRLPKRDGIEVCRELRRRGVLTPILMLTVRDAVDVKVEAFERGADDYLTKPFAFAELLARARALVRRRQPVDLRLRVGELVLDPVTRRVTCAGREIALTPKEFALLECLMRHPNEALTRARLMQEAWGESFDALTNIVDVYINALRKKLDRAFSRPLIHTVRGVGYMLRE